MIGKYIGGLKIVNESVDSGDTTPIGSTVVDLTFEDGSHELLPSRMLEAVMTDEPVDPSKLRDLRVVAVCAAIIEQFAEYDIKLNEFDHIVQTLKMTLDENFGRATEILWETKEKRWLDMVRVLKSAGSNPVS